MPRAFLCWASFLAGGSWAGIAAAEAGRFAAVLPLLAGALAAAATARATSGRGAHAAEPTGARPPRPGGEAVVLAMALVASCTLLPPVDTTLSSQDASIHRLAGLHLGREGSLVVHDPLLAEIGAADRRGLFEQGALGLVDLSRVRFPGGLVAPSERSADVVPSFAHLLAVWIAVADGIAGERAVGWLGPTFVATAWWAVGLLASRRGGVAAAAAAIALLATWLPQHWFGRFLMPEVLAEALVWCGAAAIAFAPTGTGGAAAAVGGLSLGVACFARLEQLTIFLPSLLLARALLPSDRRVLPRAAWPWLGAAAVHAAAHLAIVPTDYGKRMAAVATGAIARAWSLLGGEPRTVAVSGALLLLAVATATIALRRARPGIATRVAAGAGGSLAFAGILAGTPPDGLPAVSWLSWYVPWPAWIAAAIGLLPPAWPPGAIVALAIEAIDQVVSPRVTPEQVWGSRRLVTVVLPLVALAAARALRARSRPQPWWLPRAAAALVVLAVAMGALGLRAVAFRRPQHGSAAFAREIDQALPAGAAVLVAGPLDWLHLAPLLWSNGARDVIVARDRPGFREAAARRLAQDAGRGRPLFYLSGAMVEAGEGVEAGSLEGVLPPGWTIERQRAFAFTTRLLERTSDRAPRVLVPRVAEVTLHRLRPPVDP